MLIVDDDPGVCETLSDALKERGYHVRVFQERLVWHLSPIAVALGYHVGRHRPIRSARYIRKSC